EATLEDDRLEVRVDDGGPTAPRLLNELEAAGHEIVDLEITRTSLEEIFVDLTRQDDRTTTRSDAPTNEGAADGRAVEGESEGEDEGTPAREQEGIA
ncbi:DUF4162 domain-containing protein, partial [Natronococcus sp.]|uniref:ATP-binding protein DrrA1-3 family domain-containing protein n=1 Tax=Natronococcus sp. TaxID=35747 RepID=UPI003A4DF5E3